MDFSDLADALQVHAAAAAAQANSKFVDVAVGFDVAKGKSVRIFYDGEREAQHVQGNRTLNSLLIGQAIHVRARWPAATTGKGEQRTTEIEMATFMKEFRTRVLGDSQIGGESIDVVMTLAEVGIELTADAKYAVVDTEVICDWDEFSLAP